MFHKTNVTNSHALIAFIVVRQGARSRPQRQYVLTMDDGLIVGEGSKALSAPCRLSVNAPDPKAAGRQCGQTSGRALVLGLTCKQLSAWRSIFLISLRQLFVDKLSHPSRQTLCRGASVK